MKLRYNKATLHNLPPAGRRWQWSDVVGHADRQVDPTDAHAARSLIESHGDGVWETTRRLEEYLDEMYSIELEGDVTETEQSTLPIGTGRAVTDRPRVIGVESPPAPTRSNATRVQVGLDGEPAEAAVAAVKAHEDLDRNESHGDHGVERHVEAVRDTWQTALQVFDRITAGRLRRATGRVYPAADAVSVDA